MSQLFLYTHVRKEATLLLCAEGMLREPLLYLSLFLKQHRQRYYELLEVVRREGDWERWLAFFAEAVKTTAAGAVQTARTLVELFRADRERIGTLGRATGSALRVHHELQRRPVSNIAWLTRRTKHSAPTVGKALEGLGHPGIVRETTGEGQLAPGRARRISVGGSPQGAISALMRRRASSMFSRLLAYEKRR